MNFILTKTKKRIISIFLCFAILFVSFTPANVKKVEAIAPAIPIAGAAVAALGAMFVASGFEFDSENQVVNVIADFYHKYQTVIDTAIDAFGDALVYGATITLPVTLINAFSSYINSNVTDKTLIVGTFCGVPVYKENDPYNHQCSIPSYWRPTGYCKSTYLFNTVDDKDVYVYVYSDNVCSVYVNGSYYHGCNSCKFELHGNALYFCPKAGSVRSLQVGSTFASLSADIPEENVKYLPSSAQTSSVLGDTTLPITTKQALSTSTPIVVPDSVSSCVDMPVTDARVISTSFPSDISADVAEGVEDIPTDLSTEGTVADSGVLDIPILGSIVSAISSVFDLLKHFFDVSEFSLDFKPLKAGLSEVFPFCIPWDLLSGIRMFSGEPTDFVFSIDFDTTYFSVHHTVDLAPFRIPMLLFRYGVIFWFSFILISRTRDFIKW